MAEPRLDENIRAAIDQYVKSDLYDGGARSTSLPIIVQALNEKKAQLLDIVIHLEPALGNSSDPTGRRLSVRLLSDCLNGTPQIKLNFKHVETFAQFFLGKFSDWQCVEGAVGGILVLLRHHGPVLKTLKDENDVPLVVNVTRQLLKEVHTPSHTQPVRKTVLDVIGLLLDDWSVEISQLGEELGDGFIAAVDEERDPRNLLMSFSIIARVLEKCGAICIRDETLNSAFEILNSYFPITFTPPKDDKFGITADDLKEGLNRAFGSTPRLAPLVVPFLLDTAKDISGSEEDTINQALASLASCFELYGPELTQEHLKDVLATARDQVCRTENPCAAEFATCVRRTLVVALKDVPGGLTPHWLSRDIYPAVAKLAEDAARGEASLSSTGARHLLLAIASAHRVLLQRVWTSTMSLLCPSSSESAEAAEPLQQDALSFVLNLSRLAESPTGPSLKLGSDRFKLALNAVLATLGNLQPGASLGGADTGLPKQSAMVVIAELVGCLCRLAGESESGDGFKALCLTLFDGAGGGSWEAWRRELESASADDVQVVALIAAIAGVVAAQPLRALDVAPMLLSDLRAGSAAPLWLACALPGLTSAAALSLAQASTCDRSAGLDEDDDEEVDPAKAAAEAKQAGEISGTLLARCAKCVRLGAAWNLSDAAIAVKEVTDAFEKTGASAVAQSWAASQLAIAMELPQKLPDLSKVHGACQFIRVLDRCLPPPEAQRLRKQIFDFASAVKAEQEGLSCLALVPGVLPAAAQDDWAMCKGALAVVQTCMSKVEFEEFERVALEALEALVEACPSGEVESLLTHLRETFGESLNSVSGAAADPFAGRGAVLCWAAAAAGLWRREGFSDQAAAFLEALLTALEKEGPITRFVPLAFQVLMPPQVTSSDGPSQPRLPPLALQRLSRTTLPSLVAKAKAAPDVAAVRDAALRSAVTLLAALPKEVACADCSDDLRWCVLVGLKGLMEQVGAAAQDLVEPSAVVFATQLLQVLIRALLREAAWVDEDLHSVVLPLATISTAHRVPLVRLACLQALTIIVNQSYGLLTPFKKQIEAATKGAIEDRRREVRLAAVCCLNAWHCGASKD